MSDPVPVLRRQLASPRLSFRGRQERNDSDLLSRVDEWRADPGKTAYEDTPVADLDQLAEPLALGEFEEGRTLRGFIRPVNRITRQLQQEGLIAADVAPALVPGYEQGVQAAYFAVPPDVRKLLTTTTGTSHPYSGGQKKNAIKGRVHSRGP